VPFALFFGSTQPRTQIKLLRQFNIDIFYFRIFFSFYYIGIEPESIRKQRACFKCFAMDFWYDCDGAHPKEPVSLPDRKVDSRKHQRGIKEWAKVVQSSHIFRKENVLKRNISIPLCDNGGSFCAVGITADLLCSGNNGGSFGASCDA